MANDESTPIENPDAKSDEKDLAQDLSKVQIQEGNEGGESDDYTDADDDEEEDFMDMLPGNVRQRVEKLKDLHSERENLLLQYQKDRAALEKKYADLYAPLYEKRHQIISGKLDEEIKEEAKLQGESNDQNEKNEEGANLVGVPEFWLCAIGNLEGVSDLITERDNECLLYLDNITCDENEEGTSFKLQFYFRENPFFENKVLTKTYEIPNLLLDDEPILKNVEGCEIKWKHSKCLTHTVIKKKQKCKSGKNAGQVRTIIKKEKHESFFHFFSPPEIPKMEEMDEETAGAIEEAFDSDYDIAQAFRSHIIPKAVLWFTGEAMDEGVDAIIEGDNWPSPPDN